MMEYGKKEWLAADCFWPEITTPGHYVSHEAICVLNTSDQDAHLTLTLYFSDREPMEGFRAECPARRTVHIRMDQIRNESGEPVPMGVPYAALVCSDTPVVCQYSRIDTTQVNETFGTTIMA